MRARSRLGIVLVCLLVPAGLAACGGGGGGDDGNHPDAPIDAPVGACGAVAGEIGAYPGMVTGKTVGAGADLTVAAGACADERQYFGEDGEDQVVQLTNLVGGKTYVVDLETTEDLTFYVTGTCTGNMPAAGSCLLHVDETTGNETGEFVAPSSGDVFVIVDSANDPAPPTSGDYTLHVRQAECTSNPDCTNAGTPVCDNFSCVQCASNFDCNAAAPVCDSNACVAGGTACTGDDGSEPDDGPSQATSLTLPTAGNPTTVNRAVCSEPVLEDDWYRLNITAAQSIRIGMSWADTGSDLDFIVYDSTGQAIDGGIDSGPGPEAVIEDFAVGTYYIEVYKYSPGNVTAATPYTLSLQIPECTTSFDCTNAAKPLCDTGQCFAGPTQCTGDDAGDAAAGGDDGPAAARDLTGVIGTATTLMGNVCNTPSTEFDWYKVVTVAPGEGLHLSLSWPGANDIDIAVFDSTGKLVGLSFWLTPEVVDLSYLPAGTYYVRIALADAATTTAAAYSITATRQVAAPCTQSAQCATTYSNQIFRGNCAAGACQFIAAGARAANAPCDSGDDCASGRCSYSVFESDAQKSVCTVTCTGDADCTAVAATGFACTTGFGTNLCMPKCTTATECGANPQSGTVDVGTPWDYFTCTAATGACSP